MTKTPKLSEKPIDTREASQALKNTYYLSIVSCK